jgi:uncharacterized membrane protein YheB (UPF0754 family)
MYIELKKGGKGTKKEGETCTWQALGSQCESGSCYNGKCCSKQKDSSVIGHFILLKNYVALENYFVRFTERIKNFLEEYKKSDSIRPKFLKKLLENKEDKENKKIYDYIDKTLTEYLNEDNSGKKKILNEIIDRIINTGMYDYHKYVYSVADEVMNYLIYEEGIRIANEVAKEHCCSQKANIITRIYPPSVKRQYYFPREIHYKAENIECAAP